MGAISPWHWAIVALVVIILFGAKKLPDAARSSGQVDADLQDRGQGDAERRRSDDGCAVRAEPVAGGGADAADPDAAGCAARPAAGLTVFSPPGHPPGVPVSADPVPHRGGGPDRS